MEHSQTIVVGSPIVAEFVDDARAYCPPEPEYVETKPKQATAPTVAPASAYPFTPPTRKAAAAAKKFWMRMIERFTESVPEKPGFRRVKKFSERTEDDVVVVSYGNAGLDRIGHLHAHGEELDTNDQMFLVLFHRPVGVAYEEIHPIAWTEIVTVWCRIHQSAVSA